MPYIPRTARLGGVETDAPVTYEWSKEKRTPVRVRGQTFPDFDACARHFDVHYKVVAQLVAQGRADQIGLGRGNWKRDPDMPHGKGKPCRVGGRVFRSRRMVSLTFGVSRKVVDYFLNGRDDLQSVQKMIDTIAERSDTPVTIGPLTFDSVAHAAKLLGVDARHVVYFTSDGIKCPERSQEVIGAAMKRVGANRPQRASNRRKQITIGPRTFPSIAEAARQLDTHQSTVRAYLDGDVNRPTVKQMLERAESHESKPKDV